MRRRHLILLGALGTVTSLSVAAIMLEATREHAVAVTDESCSAYLDARAEKVGVPEGMVYVPGGQFTMGSDRQQPEERLSHRVTIQGFWIDRFEITNGKFAEFVAATAYVTLAERGPDPSKHLDMAKELLVPGSVVFVQPTDVSNGGDLLQWWQYVPGADWRHPGGPGTSIEGMQNHPVVHIAFEDALAYARWRGRDLPTEAQWEYAARGGLDGQDYAWGSAYEPDGKPRANSWQGVFPVLNTDDDGYVGTAPTGCFDPNGYGLYDMIGNAWEWTTDWYLDGHSPDEALDPTGPNLLEIGLASGQVPTRVIKGGSFLCAPNYCARYRPAARQSQEEDLSAGHLGFRTVLNAPGPK